jgi:hypothetical protein
MVCPACDRLDRDEELLRKSIEKRAERPRFALDEERREEIKREEEQLSQLLLRIIERRAA